MTRTAVVHVIDPDYFVRTGRDAPWCSHGRYVPLVEHPDDATCQHCLRIAATFDPAYIDSTTERST